MAKGRDGAAGAGSQAPPRRRPSPSFVPQAQSKQVLGFPWPYQPPFPLPFSKLTLESGTDFPLPAVPPGTDPETERLIREKDEEVRLVWGGRGCQPERTPV